MSILRSQYPQFYRYYGRKISKKLSTDNLTLLNKYYNEYSLDEEIIKNYLTDRSLKLKKDRFKKINIELGFGNGEFLIKNALSKPKELFIGCEVYVNGVAKVLKQILLLKIDNIKLCNLNCIYFLNILSPSSVDKIFIINPDPWIKKRHHKRRIISLKNIKLFNKIVKKTKSTYVTTDSQSYVRDVEDLFRNHASELGDLELSILSNKDKLYGISRYQKKAIEKGDQIYLLTL